MLKKIALSILLLSCLTAHTQTLDLSFNSPIPLRPADVLDVEILPDGKYLLGGRISYFEDKKVHNLIKLNADGSLDQTFSFNPETDYDVSRIERLSSGDILVATKYSSKLLLLNSSGEIITTVMLPQAVEDIAVQENGQILICGGVDWANINGFINRYNSDLTPDTDFNDLVTIDNGIVTTIRLFNSKIYLAGTFSSVNLTAKNDIVRLNMDGTLDASFDTGTGTNDILRSMTIQDDGKIIIGGNSYLSSFNDETIFGIVRLNSNGTIDHSISFTSGFSQPSSIVCKDNKFWYGHESIINGHRGFYFLRYDNYGVLDETFTPIPLDEFYNTGIPLSYEITDENIIINRTNYLQKSGFSRFSLEGVQDDTFQPAISYYGVISNADYKNGKLIVGGYFYKMDGVPTFNVAKLNAAGICDNTFSVNYNSAAAPRIQIVDDNTIFVGGNEDLLKVNSTGATNPDFNFKLFDAQTNVARFLALPNGKVMVADDILHIYRLNSDGTKDANFDIGSGVCCIGTISDLVTQSDGKVIVAGGFQTYNENSANLMVRLNEDGSIDESFSSGFDQGVVDRIKVMPNNDLIIAGDFNSYNGDPVTDHVIKVSADGKTIDKTFMDNFPDNFYPIQLVEVDDNLIIPGETLGNNTAPYSIKSFDMDGISNEFFTLPQAVVEIYTTKIIPVEDGYLLVGSYKVNNEPIDRQMIKLLKAKTITAVRSDEPEGKTKIYPVPASDELNVRTEEAVYDLKLLSTTGVEVFSQHVRNEPNQSISIDVRNLPVGLYMITVTGKSGRTSTMKWLKN